VLDLTEAKLTKLTVWRGFKGDSCAPAKGDAEGDIFGENAARCVACVDRPYARVGFIGQLKTQMGACRKANRI
jgi:hypothetical protein